MALPDSGGAGATGSAARICPPSKGGSTAGSVRFSLMFGWRREKKQGRTVFEVACIYIDKINWRRKIISFSRAKFLGKKYGEEFLDEGQRDYPLLSGREYLDRYCGMMEQEQEPGWSPATSLKCLINDSPWEKVVLPGGERFPGSEFWKMRKRGIRLPGAGRPARSERLFCFWIRTMSWRRRPSAA